MNDRPDSTEPAPDPAPRPTEPAEYGLTEEDLRDSTIDFDVATRTGSSGQVRPHKMSDPLSGGSLISWAELLRQQQRQRASDGEVALGSLPDIQIDPVSDKDLKKHLGPAARPKAPVGRVNPPPPAAPTQTPAGPAAPGSLASRLFTHDQPRHDEWIVEAPKNDANNPSSSVDLATAARVSDAALAGDSSKGRIDDSDVLAHALMTDDGSSAVNLGMEPRAVALLSNVMKSPAAPIAGPGPRKPASRPSLRVPNPLTAWLGGAAVGVAAAGLGTFLYYGGKLPSRRPALSIAAAVQPAAPKPDLDAAAAMAAMVDTQKKLERSLQSVAARLNVAKADDVPGALDAVIAQRTKSEDEFRQAEKQLRMVTADRDTAASSLESLKKDATEHAKVALANLQTATAREAEARKALADFAAARKDADATLKVLTDKLKAAKLVGDNPKPQDFVSAFDTLMKPAPAAPAVDVAAFKAEIDRLKESLGRSRAPAQMLDLWPVMLETASARETVAAALADADVAAASADARTRAKAQAVKGFALLANADYAQARTVLEQVRTGGDLAGDAAWAGRVKKAEAELNDPRPAVLQVRRLLDRGDAHSAAAQADKGLKVFSSDAFPADHARLLALRGEAWVKLDKLDDAERDAAAAVNGGAAVAGYFTAGRVAEKRGHWDAAKDGYRNAYAAGPQAAEIKPIRVALARVLARPDADAADLAQADTLADEAIQAGQAEGHLVKARVLYRQKKHTEALQHAMQGLSGVAPAEFADGWGDLVKNHPAFSAKPSSTAVVSAPAAAQDPDPALAERYFAAGLSLYYARNFDAAEADFQTAVQNHGEDARFLYFRGLARLPLGKIEAAQDDFRKAVALERRGLPDSATIGMYFERIQGDERRLINQFRK